MYRFSAVLAFLCFGSVAALSFGLFRAGNDRDFQSPWARTAVARKTAKFLEQDREFVAAFTKHTAQKKPILKLPVRAFQNQQRAIPSQVLANVNPSDQLQKIPDDVETRVKSLQQAVQILETSASPEFAAVSAQMAERTLAIENLDSASADAAHRILELSAEILSEFPSNLPAHGEAIQIETIGQ